MKRCGAILFFTFHYFRITNGFSVSELSSHYLHTLPVHPTPLPQLCNLYDAPSSLLSFTAFVPSLNPQRAALALFNEYQSLLAVHPLPTKLVTGAILAVAGDAVAQSRDKGDYSASRGASFAAFDVTYRAVQHHLFPWIVENFQGRYFLTAIEAIGLSQVLGNVDVMAAMERALVNQLIVVPFFYYPVFFLFSGVQLGLTWDEGVDRAKQNFLPLMKRNLLFWVPIQYAQFAFVPLDLQIPFLCVAGLVWTYILSILAGSAQKYSNEVSVSDEVYCITMTEDQCVLPDDELIPMPAMFSNDVNIEEDAAVYTDVEVEEDAPVFEEIEALMLESGMIDDCRQVGVPNLVLTKNDTVGEEVLVP
jgi:hypothetical protein